VEKPDMNERLPVPPELEHLIEKREQDEDRRQQEQRSDEDKRQVDLGPLGAIESAKELDEVPTEERRKSKERRGSNDRRNRPRRETDS
jgi:hypothetical protein